MFRIRQIVTAASGRQIARDRTLETRRLTLGRAADNAIQIADLAVEPHHAELTIDGPGVVRVASLGTLGFAADGKAVREITLDPATPAELRFGGTLVSLARDGEAVVIEVRAAETADDSADPVAEKARFALGRVMLSSRAIGWSLALVILALFVVLPVASHWAGAASAPAVADMKHPGRVMGDKAWNPGELSLAHHTLTNRCEACHVKPFQSVRNDTCIACHKDSHDHAPPDRRALARGAPGTGARLLQAVAHVFGREPPGACTDCHVEHQGAQAMAPPRQKFCADCHAGLGARLPGSALGDAADFGTQHPELRAWITTNADTRARAPMSLAAPLVEDSGLTFSHKVHLDRTGGVAKMAMTLDQYGKPLDCAQCHRRSADGVSFEPVRMERDCEACHSLVYARAGATLLRLRHGDIAQMQADLARSGPVQPIVTGRARPGDFAPGAVYGARFTPLPGPAQRAMARDGICGECHTPQWRGGKLGVRHVVTTTRYMPNGWFDHAAHRQTACADCHAAAQADRSGAVILPRLAQCRSCHLGEAASKPKVPSGCAMCHTYHQSPFAPPADRRHRGMADQPRVALLTDHR